MASPTYLGSWEVDQGPNWGTNPPTYSGQQAAALLFGSLTGDSDASDYVISTNGSDPSLINNGAWYSVYGGNVDYSGPAPLGSYNNPSTDEQGLILADDFTNATNYNSLGDVSSYVWDNARGSTFMNYAFYDPQSPAAVPEPASMAVFGTALAGFGLMRRRKRA